MRRARWYVSMVLLLVSLASCGPVSQNQQRARVSIATPTPTTTASNSSASLNVPAQPVPTRTATPTPRLSNNHAVPAQTGGSGGSGSQLEQQLFHLINQDRADQGLYPYMLSSTLSNGARQHSQTMADGCGLQHQCPGEPDPCQRVTDEGIAWTSCGENIGYSSPDPTAWGGVQAIDQDMLDEQPPNDGHRQNLLSSSFHRVGIGIVIDSRGIVWVTEDFAS